ncbi:MAG: excinuclease ABC subunit UvrC [Rhodoluna sp.]
MNNSVSFRPATGDIPKDPGVYRFIDGNGRVLYVGKAKNLRARLSSYFVAPESLPEKTRRMVQSAADVNWTIVKSEFEALQLEFTWIKEFDPPFNVRFKDDKSYPYLAITMSEEVPRVLITRNRDRKGTKYFGPYTQSWAIRETMDTMLKVFPMRSCSSGIYQRAVQSNRPCLLADIGKCSAPCVGRISLEDHKKNAKQFGDFISSGDEKYIKELQVQMKDASTEQKYELAGKLRDDVAALETVLEKSTVVFTDQTDADLFGIADDELTAAVSLFKVRGGRIRGARGWVVDKEIERTTEELIEYLLQNVYETLSGSNEIPKEVLVPELPSDSSQLAQWLTDKRGSSVSLRVPQRGDKRALAETASTNAKHALGLYKLKRTADFTARSDALAQLQKLLNLETAPLRIECFDISHLSGTGIVASMVVFEDGLPKKSQYRKFNIESSTDDTDSMFQVLTRRLKYLSEKVEEGENRFSYRPGLLVVDGGLPQVNAAKKALVEAGIGDIALIGLAKRLEEIWLPNSEFPVILPRTSEALFLLQRVRDEAHRFAITAQRKQRKSAIATELGEIEGLGDKRVNALLRRFGSAKRLRMATIEEISEVAGIGPKLGEIIQSKLNQSD